MPREALRRTKTKIICAEGRTKTTIKETSFEVEDDPFLELGAVGFDVADDEDELAGIVPRVGDMVLYKLSSHDIAILSRDRLTNPRPRIGNPEESGNVRPMLIVRVWGETPQSAVNGQVFLDGNDVLWVTSRMQGDDAGQFAYSGD